MENDEKPIIEMKANRKDLLNEITLHNTLQRQKINMWRLKKIDSVHIVKRVFLKIMLTNNSMEMKYIVDVCYWWYFCTELQNSLVFFLFLTCNHYKNILWIFCLNWELKAAFSVWVIFFYWKHMAHLIGRFWNWCEKNIVNFFSSGKYISAIITI